jgi:hypothetical protein
MLNLLCKIFIQVLLLEVLIYLRVSYFLNQQNPKIYCHVHTTPPPDLPETIAVFLYSHRS